MTRAPGIVSAVGSMGLVIAAWASIAEPSPPDGSAGGAAPVPLGLRLSVDPPDVLTLVPGRRYTIGTLSLEAFVDGPDDHGVADLAAEGLFAGLDWSGLELRRDDVRPADDAWIRERIYTRATWMLVEQSIAVSVLDTDGDVLDGPVTYRLGAGRYVDDGDAFAIRRASAIQTATGCPDDDDCTGATFRQEAFLQARNPVDDAPASFLIDERAATLRVVWSVRSDHAIDVPLAFEASPAHAYGFSVEMTPLDEAADGQVAPGDAVSFRLTFRDGAGKRLHDEGMLPTYRDFLEGRSAGLVYFDFDQGVLFYDDKNAEGVLLTALGGPRGRLRQVYSELTTPEFLERNQVVADPKTDGYYAEWQLVPPGDVLFGGAFGDPALWDTPISDVVTFHVPGDAEPGEYVAVAKARREYLGEVRLASVVTTLAVGDGEIENAPWVGKCETCHTDALDLSRVLHTVSDTDACDLCHVPLDFEPDNMLAYRMHYVHYFSDRYDQPKDRCIACHEVPASIQRPSYLVCLACHLEYHGGAEEFGQYGTCADTRYCHPDHNFPWIEPFEVAPPPFGASPYPNPFNPWVTIPYRVAGEGEVRIRIYDARGRLVRAFDASGETPGEHEVVWDGTDTGGVEVASGSYVVSIRTAGTEQTRQLRLIR